ncbi:putative 2-phosphosulfolactate phosphatase [Planctomycetes bacterium MalM25]|nr:putative 2-phosphosulfolactate phosphatase [Planctomycetes bacterium MalM25]
MTKQLFAHDLPQFVSEADLAGDAVVVIDLLRASTTITQALASGARDVTAFREVGDVIWAANEQPDRDELVLGGERGGEIIEGFDLGNSPAEYTADEVYDRRVFFTTTNGTLALQHTRLASRVVVGAIVNLSAVVEALADEPRVHLLCAGTNGHVTREDQLAAGAIAHELIARGGHEPSDRAAAMRGEWEELLTAARAAGQSPRARLAEELRTTQGGKNLLALGMDDDLPRCAAIDALGLVPVYDPATGRITAL